MKKFVIAFSIIAALMVSSCGQTPATPVNGDQADSVAVADSALAEATDTVVAE